jgi:hypothetical protein
MIKAKKAHHANPTAFYGVASTKNDDAFAAALNESARAEKKLESATMICVRETAKKLLRTLMLFNGDEVTYLTKRFQETLETGGHLASLGVAANIFLSDTRKSGNLDVESPEGRLINAVRLLQDAIDDLGSARYVDAHANSVRCRASLQKIIS